MAENGVIGLTVNSGSPTAPAVGYSKIWTEDANIIKMISSSGSVGGINLANYTLTIPATGTPALLGTANTFTASSNTFRGTSANDLPTYSAEFLDSSNWTLGSGWSGDFASGFTHTSGGGTATLTHDHAAVATTKYQITYTVTGRTTGDFVIAFGGQTSAAISATGAWGPTATTTGNLVITPSDLFNGTVVISIKSITVVSTAIINIKNSAGTVVNEIRSGNSDYNMFIGVQTGKYTTTGTSNLGVGSYALLYNTTGNNNVSIGRDSLGNNTTGYFNVAIGCASMYGCVTGYSSVSVGYQSGRTITTGNTNTFVGYYSGYHASQKVDATNSTAIGANTYTTASNQVVIGDTNVTSTVIRGAISILANNIVTDTTTGMKIGTGTTQKIGFFNATPVVQAAHITDATNATDVITRVNAILVVLENLGLVASS